MPLFGRPRPEPVRGDPVAFWGWWAERGRALVSDAVGRGEPAGTVEPLGHAVAEVHPDLSWEIAPGELSEHVLVVTAAGNPDLRASARRWLLAAPPSDETWSYSDHRLPHLDPEAAVLGSETGEDVDFARIRVSARTDPRRGGQRFDVALHHPAFPELAEPARMQVAFLALDLTLGEYDVELWIGDIQASEHPVLDGFGLGALRAVVGDLKAQHVDADGHPSWALMQGEGPEGPVLALAQVPLHPVTQPLLSVHAALTLPFTDVTPEGMPGEESLAALRRVEDELSAVLGPDGQVVAHQTSGGTRVLHLYVDEVGDAEERVRRVADGWRRESTGGRSSIEVRLDPSWQGVAHLRP